MQRRHFFPIVLFILAYEWLVSGLDKVISGTFITDFHHQLVGAISGGMHYPLYASLLQAVVVPNSTLFAWLVESGELGVGTAFVVLGVMVLMRQNNRVIRAVGVVTGMLAAFMTLNFFLYQGRPFLLSVAHPFDEGVSIGLIMVLLQLAVAGRFWRPRRRAHGQVEIKVYAGGRGRHMA